MKELDRFKERNEKTQKMLALCIDTLHKINGSELPQSFWVTIDMLADAFDVYYTAYDNVTETGTASKFSTKNPSTAVFSQQQLYINRLLNNLGLTPMAAAKIKKGADAMPSELDEFIG